MRHHNKNKFGFHELPVILSVLAIAAIGIWYGYNNYFNTPGRVYSQMTEKMQTLEKGHMEVETTVNLGGAKNLLDIFVATVNPEVSGFKVVGDFDVSNAESPKYRISTVMSQFSRDAFDIETRTVDGVNYFHIDYIGSGTGSSDLSYYPESWFVQKSEPDLSPSSLDILKDVSRFEETIISVENIGDSNIGQVATHHFSLNIDSTLFKRNIDKLFSDIEFEFENRETKKLLDELEVTKAEVWIGKSDKYLYRAHFEFESEFDGTTVKLTTEIDFSDFENIEEIEAPEEFIEFNFDPEEDVNERLSVADQTREKHLNYIANAVHEFYKKNGSLPDDYPQSPACLGSDSTCYDLKQSQSAENGEYLVPEYITQIPREAYAALSGYDEYHTYATDGKLYLIATDSKGDEMRIERVLE